MGCPFFEPTEPVTSPRHPGARLPLIREYAGLCHATAAATPVPEALRFDSCNCGYSAVRCSVFPALAGGVSCLRFTVRGETPEILEVLCLEERDYAPVRWQSVCFDIAEGRVRGDLSVCARAQVEAFSRSYLVAAKRNDP